MFVKMLTSRLRWVRPSAFSHWCPACMKAHTLEVGSLQTDGHCLGFDGDVASPTFEPQIVHRDAKGVCTYVLRAGRLQFGIECTHDLAGREVELPYFPLS